MKKLGVIVGRFQTGDVTEGHGKLIELASKENDNLLIIIGESPTRLTLSNPLPSDARKKMIEDYCYLKHLNNSEVVSLRDCKFDNVWSDNLDKLLLEWADFDQISIYTGRDGFSQYYTGKHTVKEVSFGIDHVSATELRKRMHESPNPNSDWRAGVIYASAHRFPVSYETVDIAIINYDKLEVLLGKKEGELKYRFIGGFVDTTDESFEQAAKREVIEECGHIETNEYKYLGSFRIDDWRYRKDKDKIMTAFFACAYIFGHAQASDDIAETQWVDLNKIKLEDVEKEHQHLLEALLEHISECKINSQKG